MPAGVRVPRGCSVVPTGLGRCGDVPGAEETVSQPPFRTFDACSFTTFYPRLAPWAALLRRFAARIVTRGPLFVQSGGCDTVSEAPLFHGAARICELRRSLQNRALMQAARCKIFYSDALS